MFRIDISAGEAFELLRPVALVISAIVSTWIFASALKRFSFVLSFAIGVVAFVLPFLTTPVYLAFLVLKRPSLRPKVRRRFIISFVYALVLLSSIAIYVWLDRNSVDAHLARANQARVRNDRNRTIREYRAALALEDNPHTHKLLAIELADAGRLQEAVTEFRFAEQGGEEDDSIHFRLGESLEKLQQVNDAATEYQKFLNSNSCVKAENDSRCEQALQKLHK